MTEWDKKNCTSYDWCRKNGPKDLHCDDCDNYSPEADTFILGRNDEPIFFLS